MSRASALALMGAMAFTNAAQIHTPDLKIPIPAGIYSAPATMGQGPETLVVYYSPLPPTELAKYLGFGIAYHMAIIYTDASGRSFGASARPSNLKSALTPRSAFAAILHMANDEPSSFGTLVADPRNNTVFIENSSSDFYTQNASGRTYPHTLLMRGKDLSDRWASIVQTYDAVGSVGLTYSPMSQNSNSLAAAALRAAGVGLEFSSSTYFAPGTYTALPQTNSAAVLKTWPGMTAPQPKRA